MTKILAIGNALVDIMTSLENDSLLEKLNLPKGSMQLVDDATSAKAMESTKGLKQVLATGGSAANTTNGLSNLGIETSFIGKVGKDELGDFFRNDMKKNGINPMLLTGKAPTGRALALVSTDSERTFAVNLGAAIEMVPDDLSEEMFAGYNYFHIEGYLVQNHSLIEKALILAKKAGLIVSLDMASFNVVEANRNFLKKVITNYVDIVFANEDEAKAFTGLSPEDSLHALAELVKVAIVKVGSKGSMIKSGNEVCQVGVIKVNPIDSTGAGDLYASGFLFGHSKGLSLKQCGSIGAVLSGKVIEVMGPKMPPEIWGVVKNMVNRIIKGEELVS